MPKNKIIFSQGNKPNVLLSNFTPEFDLLLSLALFNPDEKEKERIVKNLEKNINWDLFLDLCHFHGIYPIAFKNLNSLNHPLIPEKVIKVLENKFFHNSLHISLLAGELVRLFEIFDENNLRVIPLKGPVLAMELFGDFIYRRSVDLDLLVSPDGLNRAEKILIEAGFKKTSPKINLTKDQYNIFLKETLGCHYQFIHKTLGYQVELHWKAGVLNDTRPDFEELWSNCRAINFLGYEIKIMSPEDNYIMLAIHSTKHLWKKLKWISDIWEMSRKKNYLDWGLIDEKSKKLGVGDIVSQAAILASVLHDIKIPLTQNASQKSKDLAKLAVNYLAYTESTDSFTIDIINKCRIFGSRYFLKRLILPDFRIYNLISFPDKLYPLYYLISPFYKTYVFTGKKLRSFL